MSASIHIICHECDLLLQAPQLQPGEKAHCPRCRFLLTTRYRHSTDRVLSFAFSALVFLVASLGFPFLGLNAQGQDREISLLASLDILYSSDYGFLALLFLLTVVLLPLFFLVSTLYVFLAIKMWKPWGGARTLLRFISYAQPWNMAEIFIIGILVSFIKITSMADVSLGLSFWAFILFVLCLNACVLIQDRYQTWHLLRQLYHEPNIS